MASTSNIQTTSASAPSFCFEHVWKYEVFVSFKGETRDSFTSHLCNALHEKFIYYFKDDQRLEVGSPIKKELLDAIEKSRMAVIIISKEYASSAWCLEELAKIVECMKAREMKVLPIFYRVDPTDVRKQEGTFRVAFAKHEKNPENKDKVQTWRNAMTEVANLCGHHLKNGDESMFIKDIVKSISRKLRNCYDDHQDKFVGTDSRVKEMHLHLDIGLDDVRFIGICGMSGMGKTTLARVVFQKLSHNQFQAQSFLENVSFISKRNGLVALQEKILADMNLKDDHEKCDVAMWNRLRNAKVLLVLDDVDEIEQLEKLAGNCNWFGPGSRIIVTTEDEHLLTRHGVKIRYRIKGLNKKEALQLFSQGAFHDPDPCEDQDCLDLCNDYVSYADGHPLTLKVLGSSLFEKGRKVWKSSWDRLQSFPNSMIQQRLKISFDALGDTEQKMFLDIACFFNGEEKDRVVDLLEDSSDCFPDVDIGTLVDKSLITILGGKLWMHNLLQRMGQEIVRCEYPGDPQKRSRLWRRDDILEVLHGTSGTYKVQGIMLSTSSRHQEEDLHPEAFSNMEKLRLIKICDVNLPQGLNSLPNWLRLMEWHKYPLTSIPESFQPSNLVELIMHRSSFLQLPKAFLNLNKLKVLDFSGSENLMMAPDLSGCPSLQRLIFEGCTSLDKVHPSIGALNQLVLLNLKDCKCLSSFPHKINLESLNLLILSGCSSLDTFPEIGQNMKHLSELYLDGTAIEEPPLSIQHLTGLTLLNLRECRQLLAFASVICSLTALRTLTLSGCKGQPPFPVLFSIGAPVTLPLPLPSFFSELTSLAALDLSDCNLLDGALPDNLSGLSSLESLNLSRNNFTCLPESISELPKLKFLYLDNCNRLQLLSKLPSTIQFVMARECTSLQNYSNQVVSTSGGGEVKVSNYLPLAAHEKDTSEVFLLDIRFQPPRVEEKIHQSDEYQGMPQIAILTWFNQKQGSSISVPLPYDLSKDSSWRGIVLHSVLLGTNVHGVVHELICSLDMDGGLASCSIFLSNYQHSHDGSFALCLYISHARLRNHLDQRNCITTQFTSNNPSIVIEGCGARLLYEQDMVQFVQILRQKNLGGIPPLIVQYAGRLGPHDKFYAPGPPEWVYDFCYPPSKILEWFTYQSDNSLVKIPLPPNDRTCIGLALCASLSVPGNLSNALDNPGFQLPSGLICHLETNIETVERFHTYCLTKHDLNLLLKLGEFVWLSYIPRGLFPDFLDECSWIRAFISTDCPGSLTVEKCGLRLLYSEDELNYQFEETKNQCWAPYSNEDVLQKLLYAAES